MSTTTHRSIEIAGDCIENCCAPYRWRARAGCPSGWTLVEGPVSDKGHAIQDWTPSATDACVMEKWTATKTAPALPTGAPPAGCCQTPPCDNECPEQVETLYLHWEAYTYSWVDGLGRSRTVTWPETTVECTRTSSLCIWNAPSTLLLTDSIFGDYYSTPIIGRSAPGCNWSANPGVKDYMRGAFVSPLGVYPQTPTEDPTAPPEMEVSENPFP